jgi:hypothetical protein
MSISTVLSVLHCIQASRPTTDIYDEDTLRFSVPYASLSMSLNVLISISLLWRIIDLRRQLPANMDNKTRTRYTSIEAMVVESALPLGLVSFAFVISYGVHSISAHLFSYLLVQLEVRIPIIIH